MLTHNELFRLDLSADQVCVRLQTILLGHESDQINDTVGVAILIVIPLANKMNIEFQNEMRCCIDLPRHKFDKGA